MRPGLWLFCQKVYLVYLSSVVDTVVDIFPFTQCTISDVFVDVLIHALLKILSFDEEIRSVNSLVLLIIL